MLIVQILLASLPVLVFTLIPILASGAKSHVQPARFFIAALGMLVIAYAAQKGMEALNASLLDVEKSGLELKGEAATLTASAAVAKGGISAQHQVRIDELNLEADKKRESVEAIRGVTAHFVYIAELLPLVAGAFAGAMASAAVTNWSKERYDAKVLIAIQLHFRSVSNTAKGVSISIKNDLLTRNTDPDFLKELARKKASLAQLVRELELISADLTRRELERARID